jgi:hypothetical protein
VPDGAEEVVDTAKATAEEAKDKAGETVKAGVRRIQGPEAEPVDLIGVAGKEGAKRVVPAVGGVIALILLIWWLINRG